MRTLVVALVVALPFCPICWGAEISLGTAENSSAPGQIIVPLRLQLSNGESVAALEAEFNFDAGAIELKDISPGPAAQSADKKTNFSNIRKGCARLIIAGMNQQVISSGIVANLTFAVPAGSSWISLANARCASPIGESVPVRITGAKLTVGEISRSGSWLNLPARYLGAVVLLVIVAVAVKMKRGTARARGTTR